VASSYWKGQDLVLHELWVSDGHHDKNIRKSLQNYK